MINTNGDWLYTCAEISYVLGVKQDMIQAGARYLFGSSHKLQFTISEAQKIKMYLASLSPEREELRIKALFDGLGVSDKDAGSLVKICEQQRK